MADLSDELWSEASENVSDAYRFMREKRNDVATDIRKKIEGLWPIYKPYADADFIPGFAQDVEARFWEMYLSCKLLRDGKKLLTRQEIGQEGGNPDICVLEGEQKIWIECIAPTVGKNDGDKVPTSDDWFADREPKSPPTRQAELRITSGLWEKSQQIEKYLRSGKIGAADSTVVAISTGNFGWEFWGNIETAFFPIGQYTLQKCSNCGKGKIDIGVSEEIVRLNGGNIPRIAFLSDYVKNVSGVIWSPTSYRNFGLNRDHFALIHNPRANIKLPCKFASWDREIVCEEGAASFSLHEL